MAEANNNIIIVLRNTDKSRFFVITEFNNNLFYHSMTEFVFLINNIFRKRLARAAFQE